VTLLSDTGLRRSALAALGVETLGDPVSRIPDGPTV